MNSKKNPRFEIFLGLSLLECSGARVDCNGAEIRILTFFREIKLRVLTFSDVVAAHEEIDGNELDIDNEFNTKEEDGSNSVIDPMVSSMLVYYQQKEYRSNSNSSLQ